jgi:hypothetical protein
MKNHKGSVPALLTLGLVLVGSLVTIGISVLTNTNKIASNPRAAETCTTGFYALKGDPLVSGSGCAPVCGSDCQECNWNGVSKWQCKTATSGGGNIVPSCTKARTYASLTNCKAEHPGLDGDANCKQCLLGQTNRVEYGGTGPPAGGSEEVKNACDEAGGSCNFYADCNYGTYGGKANKYCSDINEKDECCRPKGSGGNGGSMTNNLCTKASTSNSTNTCVKKTGTTTNDSFCRNQDYNGGWSNWTCIEGDPTVVCCSRLGVGGGGEGDKDCGGYDGDCVFGDNTTTKGPLDCYYFGSNGNDTIGCNPIPTTGDCSIFSARQCGYISYCNYDSKNKKCVDVESNGGEGCHLWSLNGFSCPNNSAIKYNIYKSNSSDCDGASSANTGDMSNCWGATINSCSTTYSKADDLAISTDCSGDAPPVGEGGIVNNSDDQVCIDRFQTAYTYCGRNPCTRQDNMGKEILEYEYSDFKCGSDITRTYNCCVRSDVEKDLEKAAENKSLPTIIPESNNTGDNKKCTDAFKTIHAYCGSIYGCVFAPAAIIKGEAYKYETQEYFCNLNLGIDAKCCVAGPKINDPTVTSDTTSAQTPVTTSGGEQGSLINLPGGPAFAQF